jgi:PIN domain nuclease of toxin-antitoxin system
LTQLGDPANELYLSAASAWEIAIKYSPGRLPLPEPPARFVPSHLSRDGVIALPIEPAHALAVADLPQHHNDPFDRLLVVQAQLGRMTLVSGFSFSA